MCFRGVAAFMDLFLDLGPVLECDHDTGVLADGRRGDGAPMAYIELV